MTLAPGTVIDGYEVLERVGEGGMGTVFRAYQASLNRSVAIKVLHARVAGAEGVARFLREGRTLASLRHPNIVTVFDFGEREGTPYLVSEFVEGGTLRDQIGTPLPLEYVVRMLAPIASALDYAHARGIVHRDVKPSNILVARDGTPVLSDFGLARVVAAVPSLTHTGMPVGTFEYMAPEHGGGGEAGPAADSYALAVTAYEMLVGRRPFASDTPLGLLFAHMNTPVPRPADQGVRLAPHAEAALLRGLAKAPQERFPTAAEFVRALSGEAVVTRPPSAVRSPRRWRRRVLVGSAFALVVLGGFAVLTSASSPPAPEPSPTPDPSPTVEPTPAPPGAARLMSTSAPLALTPGGQGQCVVAYLNDGTSPWVQGKESELWIELSDSVPAALRAWIVDLGSGVVATQPHASVHPQQVALFAFTVTVPSDAAAGNYAFAVYPLLMGKAIGPETQCFVQVR